jgi:hypothetical protein
MIENITPQILVVDGSQRARETSDASWLAGRVSDEIKNRGGNPVLMSPRKVTYDLNGQKGSMWSLPGFRTTRFALGQAHGVVVVTETFNDRWSYTLQDWLERSNTDLYDTEQWKHKPVGLVVGERELGGDNVVNVLNKQFGWLGGLIVSQTDLKVSRVAQTAHNSGGDITGKQWLDDVWNIGEIANVAATVTTYARDYQHRGPLTVDLSWVKDSDVDSYNQLWIPRQAPLRFDPTAPGDRVVLVNGSLHGDSELSNSLSLLHMAANEVVRQGGVPVIVSPDKVRINGTKTDRFVLPLEKIYDAMKQKPKAVMIFTGTHWGQASSVLSEALEGLVHTANSPIWKDVRFGAVVSQIANNGYGVANSLVDSMAELGCVSVSNWKLVISRVATAAKAEGHMGVSDRKWTEAVAGFDAVSMLVRSIMNPSNDIRELATRPPTHTYLGDLNTRVLPALVS